MILHSNWLVWSGRFKTELKLKEWYGISFTCPRINLFSKNAIFSFKSGDLACRRATFLIWNYKFHRQRGCLKQLYVLKSSQISFILNFKLTMNFNFSCFNFGWVLILSSILFQNMITFLEKKCYSVFLNRLISFAQFTYQHWCDFNPSVSLVPIWYIMYLTLIVS